MRSYGKLGDWSVWREVGEEIRTMIEAVTLFVLVAAYVELRRNGRAK